MQRSVLLMAGWWLLTAAAAWAAPDQSCLGCHPAPHLLSRLAHGERTDPVAELARFKGAAHARLSCLDCHPRTALGPHASKPAMRQCGECHLSATPSEGGGQTPLIDHLHSRAGSETPACTQCHGHHGVARAESPDSKTARAQVAQLCGSCHESEKHSGTIPQVSDYAASIHATSKAAGGSEPAAACTDCHGVHATSRHGGTRLFMARADEPETCGKCHEREAKDYRLSVHGVSLLTQSEAMPACTDCHGTHNILAVANRNSPASRERAVATCNRCHGSEDFVKQHGMDTVAARTYNDSYHGIAYRYGNPRAPTCASCHSAHDILPATSPLSPTHLHNVPGACAQCHPGAERSPQIGRFHVLATPRFSWLLFAIRVIYILLVGGSFAAFVAYIVLDLLAHRRLARAGVEEQFRHRLEHMPRPPKSALVRMLPIERLQHIVLLVTFITLAVTGLALLFPDTIAGRLIIGLCGGMSGRAIVHRVAAAMMVINFVLQGIWMGVTPQGRHNLKRLAPGLSDIRDVWQTVVLFLGLSRHRPSFGRYGYAEKFEFWALVWGTLVMTVTGCLLAFVGWTLGHLPKWVVDAAELVHMWEAILAVGAIALWHIYHVVWKPGVYPGNRAWLTGEINFEQLVLEHPLEYARAMGWLPDESASAPPADAAAEEEGEGR